MSSIPNFKDARRIVIKIGSALLVDQKTGLRQSWLDALCADIAALKTRGTDVLIVSSGAIALGRGLLGLPLRSLKLEESQAAASMGQIDLSRAWSQALSAHDLQGGQILVTLDDTQRRRRYLNAMSTMETLLKHDAVPIINENDTVATSEIRYGDNDRLAARIASMMGADILALLSDVDGLYSAPPSESKNAYHLPVIEKITDEIFAMAGSAGSELSRGGMRTKIEAAEIATNAGCAMLIAKGEAYSPIKAVENGAKCSWFLASEGPLSARKKWIAGQLASDAKLVLDEGACQAIRKGKSLLPAGVTLIIGEFERGDPVAIVDQTGKIIGCGLIAYDAKDARKLAGHHSAEVEKILGFAGRAEMIHSDNLALHIDLAQ